MKLIASILVVFTLLMTIAGCGKKAPPEKPIKIGTELWAGYAFAYVAQDKGFFKKNNVEVQLVFSKSTV